MVSGRRWKQEYLLFLRSADKRNTRSSEPLQVGDVVLVHEDSSHRFFWRLGRVVDIFPGRDGKSRAFKIQLSFNKTLVRAAQHLYKLGI